MNHHTLGNFSCDFLANKYGTKFFCRVLTDAPCAGAIIGSHIVACTNPNYNNNGNFLGVFQADQSNNCIYGNPIVGIFPFFAFISLHPKKHVIQN
jgi:hypothetical protein